MRCSFTQHCIGVWRCSKRNCNLVSSKWCLPIQRTLFRVSQKCLLSSGCCNDQSGCRPPCCNRTCNEKSSSEKLTNGNKKDIQCKIIESKWKRMEETWKGNGRKFTKQASKYFLSFGMSVHWKSVTTNRPTRCYYTRLRRLDAF